MFVEIPGGEFLIGAQKTDPDGDNFDEDAYDDEGPVHSVRLDAYQISRYSVTVSQYEVFVNEDGYKREEFWRAGRTEEQEKPDEWAQQLSYPNRPVTGVSWFEAKAFCEWAHLQLPTEAQWEKAARGPGEEYRKYSWGNEKIDSNRANYSETGIGHCSPMGCFPCGNVQWDEQKGLWLGDMAGNVWEWTDSQWGSARVIRGGSWGSFARWCRCAYRNNPRPDLRDDLVGFRVVFLP